ncbi:helix-turn-helix domain-containing protein [Pelagibacterium lacus]|uniref:Helix-turn-helix domain-containing protein n=1 Tax=Pelagibacterium lacus TaxID=2282655 RepID=A0A369W5R4_9HYPH|nr:helix-turn-helix domain-containing protein [Pelagibacterium lacus]RDE09898.1 helix-turn-helix domain-containing protein [Pelagibacterium lacus]
MSAIPTYALYGEDQSHDESWLHWETITSRSRLYGFRISPHRHDQLYQILYIETGEASVMLDGHTVEVAPPALVIVPPMAVHSFVFSTDVTGFVLTLFAQDVRSALAEIGPHANGLMQSRILSPMEGVVERDELDLTVKRLVTEADRKAPGQVAALRARLTLLLIAAHRLDVAAARQQSAQQATSERHARAFLALVDQHYRDTRKIGFYAGKLGITPTHLNRVCRQILGTSALAVIEKRIIVEARRYLQFSPLSVKEIGILLGYPDPAYFSRFFARSVGYGPQALRDGLAGQPARDGA